ncbi:DUF6397 family protein [Streptomyces sp. YS-3]|uniref:DUF6397 family protein n=1 Tax=Streptomyces sp. YS-3 TaxID=3381352 RepID=UPI0038629404
MTTTATTTTTAAEVGGKTVALGRAAQQLLLKRGEFELAVQLGHVRTVREGPGARPRVAQEEVERIRSNDGFPETLRERVRVVGTAEASQLLGVPSHRFTRLARGGHFTPVKCYLNRYRAVVWLYLAEEVIDLALRHPELINDRRLPKETLVRLGAGEDRRPRNWRGRRAAMLLQQTDDPWERAAGIASLLDPAHVAEVVPDPRERAYLIRLRPEPVRAGPDSPAAREIIERLQQAQDLDEVLWYRMDLTQHLGVARSIRPAPRPEDKRPAFDVVGAARPVLIPGPTSAPTSAPTPASASASTPAVAPVPVPVPVPVEPKASAFGQSAYTQVRARPDGRRLKPVPAERPEIGEPRQSQGPGAGQGRLRRGLARLRRPRSVARSSATAP